MSSTKAVYIPSYYFLLRNEPPEIEIFACTCHGRIPFALRFIDMAIIMRVTASYYN